MSAHVGSCVAQIAYRAKLGVYAPASFSWDGPIYRAPRRLGSKKRLEGSDFRKDSGVDISCILAQGIFIKTTGLVIAAPTKQRIDGGMAAVN